MRRDAPLIVLLVIALYSGLVGVNFGRHWDEPERIGTVIHAVARGELLPSWYNYPSVVHDLIVLSATPTIVSQSILPALAGAKEPSIELQTSLQSDAFLLRTRVLFFCFSMVSVLGTYAFMCRLRQQRFEAMVAAGLVALSWEIGYHARWIAPDVLAMAFGTLVLYALQRALSSNPGLGWLAVAAGAAGLGCGCKYPSGLLLVPVLVGAVYVGRGHPRRLVRAAAVCILVFGGAYLVTTPGTILQYKQFLTDVRFEMVHYQQGHGGGHTIKPGFTHLEAEVTYLALVVFSAYSPIACFFFLLAILGAVQLLRGDRWMAAALLSFPLVYLGYMSMQRVMMVRNLLVVVPFVAALAGRGAGACLAAARYLRGGPTAVVALTMTLFAINAEWLLSAGRSAAAPGAPSVELLALLSEPKAPPCRVTRRLRDALSKAAPALSASIVRADSEAPEWAAFYASDVRNTGLWEANRFNYTLRVFGPHEVNLNYYPSWVGRDHIVLMRLEDAQRLNVFGG